MKISRIALFFALVTGLSVFGTAQQDAVLVGAGDIASCDDLAGAQATAKVIDNIPGTVFAVGDLAYPDGSDEQFAKCYGRLGGDSKIAHALLPETTSTTVTAHPGTCATLEPLRAIRRRATTATI
jgi:hypothetical protein